MLGEAAAIARALSEEGVNDIGTLTYSIGDSPLGQDPRLDTYCTDETNAAGRRCHAQLRRAAGRARGGARQRRAPGVRR